jgi:F-type H+-transporting ATPase subunit gamma
MAGGRERILRRRIRSIQSTQKITRAQELIAASRIARAQAHVAAAQPYSESVTNVVRDLAAGGGTIESPLLKARDDFRGVGYVVIAGDRGLCGAYNSSVIRAAERAMQSEAAAGRNFSLVVIGRKVESYFRYRNYDIDAAFSGFSQQPTYADARDAGARVTELFLDGPVDRVELVYTKFLSAGIQNVVQDRALGRGDPRPAAASLR